MWFDIILKHFIFIKQAVNLRPRPIMDTARTPYIVHQCSKCPGDTEYYCKSCPCDLCPQCSHVKDLKTMDHDVVTHSEKINYMPTQEICLRHPGNKYKKYCELCQVPMCDSCSENHSHTFRGFRQFPSSLFRKKKNTILSIKEAYRTKLQQNRGIINTIWSDALFERPVLLTKLKLISKPVTQNYPSINQR